jgi:hypothetical protein
MVEALQISAFALPIPDRVADKLECRNTTEVGYRKDGIEHSLKAGIVALLRKHVHLEEPLVGILLYLDKIGNLDRCPDFRKIRSVSRGSSFGFRHFSQLLHFLIVGLISDARHKDK